MKKTVNTTHIEGLLYEHSLESRTTGPNSKNPGTNYIRGSISVATDDELLNVVKVNFTYVTPFLSSGRPNATYSLLNDIIDGKVGTVIDNGADLAAKVRVDSNLGLNEWFDARNNGELTSIRVNDGGFVHLAQSLNPDEDKRATFDVDMVITGTYRVEADEERDQEELVRIRGCVFDFRGAILPVEVIAKNPKAMDYFENIGATKKTPVFTRVRGKQVSRTVIKKTTEESAFGEAFVRETQTSQRDFVVTWAKPEPYEWDSEDTILASELTEKMANREVYLADMKARDEEYRNSKRTGGAVSANTTPAAKAEKKDDGGFDF